MTQDVTRDVEDDARRPTAAEVMATWSAIMAEKKERSLQISREQIKGCFDQISCFMLPHPGLHVPRKACDAKVDGLDGEFRALLNQYMRRSVD